MSDTAAGQRPWTIEYRTTTESTNADLVARAQRPGGADVDRTVLVAEAQTGGRGRMGRSWVAPPGSALLFSVLLHPRTVPARSRGWIGAILGLAVVDGLHRAAGVEARLKWPNDVLVRGRKVAGILAELAGAALVVGCGINVTLDRSDLPRADATSLLLEGATHCDRGRLLTAVLAAFGPMVDQWEAAAGDMDAAGLRREYLRHSATVGRRVRIELPDGSGVSGTAVDVAPDGSLVIDSGGRTATFAAGDVTHASVAES